MPKPGLLPGGQPLPTTVSINPFDIEFEYGYFFDRITWANLISDAQKVNILKRLYRGRGGMKVSWWDSEVNKWETEWTSPPHAVGVNTRISAPWNNAIHLRNSKDGQSVDPLYLTPKVLPSSNWVMRVDMRCPLLADLPTGTDSVCVGFEIPFQGSTTLYMLHITKQYVEVRGRLLKADGTIQELSADITSWFNTGTWRELRFILNPPNFRIYDFATGNSAVLNFTGVTFFPKVVPFFANEFTGAVVSGVYIGQWAAWMF